MNGLLQPVQVLAQGARRALRLALRRAALTGACLLIATLGAAFLVLAAFLGLSLLIGPTLAALTLGAALMGTALVLALVVRAMGQGAPQITAAPHPQANPFGTAPTAANAAMMAVFTAAFLLGRRLSNRRGHSNKT